MGVFRYEYSQTHSGPLVYPATCGCKLGLLSNILHILVHGGEYWENIFPVNGNSFTDQKWGKILTMNKDLQAVGGVGKGTWAWVSLKHRVLAVAVLVFNPAPKAAWWATANHF